MLEDLARKKSLATASAARARSCAPFRGAIKRPLLEFARRAACSVLPAVERIAEHLGDRLFPSQKMHLKTMRLFFRTLFGVDTTDVFFRIRIRSSSHAPPNKY